MTGFVKYFLPEYGFYVQNLILFGSLTINDNMVRLDTRYQKKEGAVSLFLFIIGTKDL